ncbi:hypothetical protein CNMCM6106_003672 [Aspergillus hiratsukae]|uniref:Reverse transcriptase domain-containing protein n=1 Tax=Aspergillus hiratsukae TaxID=1194566 RepID=A0A8H6Q9W7_9EURO|nr:hypothetical protein CNMCM6106_003672 [Aspergillus hiratsukae]
MGAPSKAPLRKLKPSGPQCSGVSTKKTTSPRTLWKTGQARDTCPRPPPSPSKRWKRTPSASPAPHREPTASPCGCSRRARHTSGTLCSASTTAASPSVTSHATGGWRRWPCCRKWARRISLPSALGAQLPSSPASPVARRLAWTAITNDVISPQHGEALPKRSMMDLVAAFTNDVEAALAQGRKVTLVKMDVQGAFDALLKRRLLKRMTEQGWPLPLIRLIDSFLSDRSARVRLEKTTTLSYRVRCGTP